MWESSDGRNFRNGYRTFCTFSVKSHYKPKLGSFCGVGFFESGVVFYLVSYWMAHLKGPFDHFVLIPLARTELMLAPCGAQNRYKSRLREIEIAISC